MPLDPNPQSRPVQLPNWKAFALGMFSNAAYQRISNGSTADLAVNRLETFFAVEGGELAMLVQLWGLMLAQCPETKRPTPTEVEKWNLIATANFMLIQFTPTGALEIKP